MSHLSEIRVSGFTIVRNALKLNYPLRESILSALPLCDEFIINCGDSTDGTEAICESLAKEFPDKIRVIHSKWERENQSGGFQLKHQTDRAIGSCRGNWCLYIQADEVLHEQDRPAIRNALKTAHHIPRVDGLLFDYLHFYGNYKYQITGRNWYRREVRLFKNFRNISAFRDAQGFRRNGKRLFVMSTHARVFHYGYVRSSESFIHKSQEMALWWGETPPDKDAQMTLRRHVGLKLFEDTHPAVMAPRIAEENWDFNPKKCPRIWDRNEIKNAITLLWESLFKFRIGEFRNYEIIR